MEQIAIYPELKRLKAENEELKRKNEDLEERLSIASPDVVHCKDCKYYNIPQKCIVARMAQLKGVDRCMLHDFNWYCADGKLKEETNND